MNEDQKFLRRLNRRTRFTQFLVWIALFFTAAGIAAGYKNWLRIHDKAKAGLAGVAEIRRETPTFAKKEQVLSIQATVNNQLKNNTEHLDSALKELRQIQDSTQHIADTVYTQVEALTLRQETTNTLQTPVIQDWSLSEVHFLLLTANQIFDLKKDKKGAIKAMTLADQLLLKRGATELLPLRKQISQDIALLAQFTSPDIDALSNTINTLQKQLEPHTPENIIAEEKKMQESLSNKELQEPEEEESLVEKVKKTITEAVVVKRNEKPLQDEMDIETQKSLYHLLSLRLETLRLMLLQGRDKNYHQQIDRVELLLKKFYTMEDYTPLIKQLESLKSVNLSPEKPDITKSLTLLESMMSTPQ